ncbi:hypothetical protein C8J57DRAFT_1247841 [Mycena rebaudengoi]|nr:hypothetical protein C8J57DRAFT_1247841 [Mycena rebaudengoi]
MADFWVMHATFLGADDLTNGAQRVVLGLKAVAFTTRSLDKAGHVQQDFLVFLARVAYRPLRSLVSSASFEQTRRDATLFPRLITRITRIITFLPLDENNAFARPEYVETWKGSSTLLHVITDRVKLGTGSNPYFGLIQYILAKFPEKIRQHLREKWINLSDVFGSIAILGWMLKLHEHVPKRYTTLVLGYLYWCKFTFYISERDKIPDLSEVAQVDIVTQGQTCQLAAVSSTYTTRSEAVNNTNALQNARKNGGKTQNAAP